MSKRDRTRLAAGVVLILLGAWLMVVRFVPGLANWFQIEFTWPLIVVGVGVFLLFLGLLSGEPGMAVPACIVGGIGGLLYWQNITGNWASWAYAWALIPGFVGIGSILSGILGDKPRESIPSGLWLLFISAIMFMAFSGFFGGPKLFGDYWPVLIILAGLWLLVRPFFKKRG